MYYLDLATSFSQATEPVDWYTTKPVMHCYCHQTYGHNIQAAKYQHPLARTKLYCVVTEVHASVNNLPIVITKSEMTGTVEPGTPRTRV